jgi:site-specific recombinase XerD
MNLQQLIEQYVVYRQTLGERFLTNAGILRAFSRMTGPLANVTDVRIEQINAFLQGNGPVTSTWHVRYAALRGFYRYAITRGYTDTWPLPATRPKRPPHFIPYIYSREELHRLLAATVSVQHPLRRAEPATLRTILLLLYGCGLRVSEARHLACSDVDLQSSVLTIRDSKFYKSRLVPFGSQLTHVLTEYATKRPTHISTSEPDASFFVGPDGKRLSRAGLDLAFRQARASAGIRRVDGAHYQPRMHDLRHTFAVHRLTEWYRQGKDVQQLLFHLSVYLGHRNLSCTQVYLSMTPELLQQAGTRFERYAGQEEHYG